MVWLCHLWFWAQIFILIIKFFIRRLTSRLQFPGFFVYFLLSFRVKLEFWSSKILAHWNFACAFLITFPRTRIFRFSKNFLFFSDKFNFFFQYLIFFLILNFLFQYLIFFFNIQFFFVFYSQRGGRGSHIAAQVAEEVPARVLPPHAEGEVHTEDHHGCQHPAPLQDPPQVCVSTLFFFCQLL